MRSYRTAEEFKTVAKELSQVIGDLEKVIDLMQASGLAELLCHADNIFNRRLAELQGWSTRLVSEATEQTRAEANNRRSKAGLMVDRMAKEAANKGGKKRKVQSSESAPTKPPRENSPGESSGK